MAQKQRGVIQILFKTFLESITPTFVKRKLIGEDMYGTRYYEVPLSSTSRRRNPPRYFVPVNKDDHTQELPAEWEAWLRYRRKEPPTKEEVEENYKMAIMKRINAEKIEAKFADDRAKELEVPKLKKGYESFPIYEEYENSISFRKKTK